MNILDLVNGSLQTIATGLVVLGAMIIHDTQDYIGGAILLVCGLAAYVIYEKFPSDPSSQIKLQ